jgi:anti-anti-sigma regulatory factor
MTLKIERSARQGCTVLALSGRLEAQHLAELQKQLEAEAAFGEIIVDLQEIRLADREAVRFLKRCEASGMKVQNCPGYIRNWMEQETTEG